DSTSASLHSLPSAADVPFGSSSVSSSVSSIDHHSRASIDGRDQEFGGPQLSYGHCTKQHHSQPSLIPNSSSSSSSSSVPQRFEQASLASGGDYLMRSSPSFRYFPHSQHSSAFYNSSASSQTGVYLARHSSMPLRGEHSMFTSAPVLMSTHMEPSFSPSSSDQQHQHHQQHPNYSQHVSTSSHGSQPSQHHYHPPVSSSHVHHSTVQHQHLIQGSRSNPRLAFYSSDSVLYPSSAPLQPSLYPQGFVPSGSAGQGFGYPPAATGHQHQPRIGRSPSGGSIGSMHHSSSRSSPHSSGHSSTHSSGHSSLATSPHPLFRPQSQGYYPVPLGQEPSVSGSQIQTTGSSSSTSVVSSDGNQFEAPRDGGVPLSPKNSVMSPKNSVMSPSSHSLPSSATEGASWTASSSSSLSGHRCGANSYMCSSASAAGNTSSGRMIHSQHQQASSYPTCFSDGSVQSPVVGNISDSQQRQHRVRGNSSREGLHGLRGTQGQMSSQYAQSQTETQTQTSGGLSQKTSLELPEHPLPPFLTNIIFELVFSLAPMKLLDHICSSHQNKHIISCVRVCVGTELGLITWDGITAQRSIGTSCRHPSSSSYSHQRPPSLHSHRQHQLPSGPSMSSIASVISNFSDEESYSDDHSLTESGVTQSDLLLLQSKEALFQEWMRHREKQRKEERERNKHFSSGLCSISSSLPPLPLSKLPHSLALCDYLLKILIQGVEREEKDAEITEEQRKRGFQRRKLQETSEDPRWWAQIVTNESSSTAFKMYFSKIFSSSASSFFITEIAPFSSSSVCTHFVCSAFRMCNSFLKIAHLAHSMHSLRSLIQQISDPQDIEIIAGCVQRVVLSLEEERLGKSGSSSSSSSSSCSTTSCPGGMSIDTKGGNGRRRRKSDGTGGAFDMCCHPSSILYKGDHDTVSSTSLLSPSSYGSSSSFGSPASAPTSSSSVMAGTDITFTSYSCTDSFLPPCSSESVSDSLTSASSFHHSCPTSFMRNDNICRTCGCSISRLLASLELPFNPPSSVDFLCALSSSTSGYVFIHAITDIIPYERWMRVLGVFCINNIRQSNTQMCTNILRECVGEEMKRRLHYQRLHYLKEKDHSATPSQDSSSAATGSGTTTEASCSSGVDKDHGIVGMKCSPASHHESLEGAVGGQQQQFAIEQCPLPTFFFEALCHAFSSDIVFLCKGKKSNYVVQSVIKEVGSIIMDIPCRVVSDFVSNMAIKTIPSSYSLGGGGDRSFYGFQPRLPLPYTILLSFFTYITGCVDETAHVAVYNSVLETFGFNYESFTSMMGSIPSKFCSSQCSSKRGRKPDDLYRDSEVFLTKTMLDSSASSASPSYCEGKSNCISCQKHEKVEALCYPAGISCLLNSFIDSFVELSCHSTSSHVCECLVQKCGPSVQTVVVGGLTKPCARNVLHRHFSGRFSRLFAVAYSEFGNYVINKLIQIVPIDLVRLMAAVLFIDCIGKPLCTQSSIVFVVNALERRFKRH
ncbi:hypothetical protein ADUPG1_008451, partial [Aduncisulcus paluster]